jgi:hypothetical protein
MRSRRLRAAVDDTQKENSVLASRTVPVKILHILLALAMLLGGLIGAVSLSVSTANAVPVAGGSDLGNFEIEGDMDVDTVGLLDWAAPAVKNSTMFMQSIDDSGDSSFAGGQNEANFATWTCVNGNVNAKTNLVRAYINQRIFNNHAFLDLAWVGGPTSGNSSPDLTVRYEFSQVPLAQQPPTTIPGGCAVTRTVGDLLVTYDFPGGTSPVNIMLYRWDGTKWVDQNLSAANVRGANNVLAATPDLIADPNGGVVIPAERFGEATIDLTAALTPPMGTPPCATFGAVNIRTFNSGENFASGAQDRLPTAGINISTCGSISIHKLDDQGNAVEGAKFEAFKDAGLTISAGTCTTNNAGDCTIPNIVAGNYWVKEIFAPTGYTASTAIIGPIAVGAQQDVVINGLTDVTGDGITDGFVNFRTQWQLTLVQNDTNLINNNHTFTATLSNKTSQGGAFTAAAGQPLTFSKTGPGTFVPDVPAPQCSTDAQGHCLITINSAATGLTTVTATFDEPGITVTTPVHLTAPATKQWVNYLLSIDGNSVNPVGNAHVFTLTLQQDTGSGFAAVGAGEVIGVSSTGVGAITDINPDGPDATSCTTNASGQCTVTVNSNVVGVLTLNANYHAVVGDTQGDFPASATKEWVPLHPAISTLATGPVTVGSAISDAATLAGGINPTGTITFRLYGPSETAVCDANNLVFTSDPVAVANAKASSGGFAPTAPGTYHWVATYSGDDNNGGVAGTCGDEGETSVVNKATTAISTTATAKVTIGTTISDTAHLAGGVNPTGTITFTVYGPNDANCSGTPAGGSVVAVNGNGDYKSASFLPLAPGTYRWIASYSGDANNTGDTGACNDSGETSIVEPAPYGNHDPGDTDPGDPYGQPVDPQVVDPYTPAPTTTNVDPQNDVAGNTTPLQPVDQVSGSETEQPAPAAPLGGLLPRTGAGIIGEGMLALLLVGAGLFLMQISRRRRSQPEA